MLVLSRELNDNHPDYAATVITCPDGTEIVVKLLATRNGAAKLGFEAPPSVRIVRRELLPVKTEASRGR